MKIIEGWGSGIPRMKCVTHTDECFEYGLSELELIDMNGAFRVNMYRNDPIGGNGQLTNLKNITDQ